MRPYSHRPLRIIGGARRRAPARDPRPFAMRGLFHRDAVRHVPGRSLLGACAAGVHREHVGAGVRPKARMLSASCHLPTRPSRRDVSSRALLGAWQTPGAPGHMAVSGPEAQLSRSIHAATADLARRCLARRKAQNEGRYDQSNNHEKRQHIPLRRYPICSPRFSRRTRKLRWSCSETGPASRRAGA